MIFQFSTYLLSLSIFLPMLSFGQIFDERYEDWPQELKINGKVVIAGDLKNRSILKNLISEKERSLSTGLLIGSKVEETQLVEWKSLFTEDQTTLQIVEELNIATLQKALTDHRIVVIDKKNALTEGEKKALQEAQKDFMKFIAHRGILIALGESAEIVSTFHLKKNEKRSEVLPGLNLIPNVLVQTAYKDKLERKDLLSALAKHPRSVGIGLEPNTALLLSGRKISVAGSGTATFLLAANDRVAPRVQTLTSRQQRRSRNPESVLLDLTQWRRDAIDRTLAEFPAAKPRTPLVEEGTLIIVGGGRTPAGLSRKMVELAGGVEKARLVYIPCAEEDSVSTRQNTVLSWKRMGVKHATYLHTKDRNQANTDEDFLEPLKNATGIYFGGGRQWNFSDSYYGTKAHQLMKDVLKRGGVIMGSSAGASIQGRYLARATPISNYKIMAFGYERGGLGFLDGVAIDQHFSERGRHKDMTSLVAKYPQLLGIGLDETTAIIVRKSKAEVVGKGQVFFFDRTNQPKPKQPDYISLPAGSEFDLATRKVIKDTTKKK